MRYPKLRELKEALRALIKGPYTYGFPRVRHVPFERFRGKPEFSDAHCIGCAACVQVCPAGALEFRDVTSDGSPRRVLTVRWDKCICCGQCERYCTTEKGIHLTNEFDFAGFKPEDFEEKVEKDLLLCEACGCVIAPLAHLQWIIRRLGPLAFTNSTLMLVSLKELAVVSEPVAAEPDAPHRGQHLTIQCPRCRRATALAV